MRFDNQLCWHCNHIHKCFKYMHSANYNKCCNNFTKYIDTSKPVSLTDLCILEKLDYDTYKRYVNFSINYAKQKLYEKTGKHFELVLDGRRYRITEVK